MKNTFRPNTFKSKTFAGGNWQGVGPVITTGPAIAVIADQRLYLANPTLQPPVYAVQFTDAFLYAIKSSALQLTILTATDSLV